MGKILQVVESAYRATVEEQDDTVIWITHAMKGAGADLAVLLRGNAVNYAVKGQDASGLRVGGWSQKNPPDIQGDVAKLIGKGVEVYLVKDDAAERGLEGGEFIDGIKPVGRAQVAELYGQFEQIWNW